MSLATIAKGITFSSKSEIMYFIKSLGRCQDCLDWASTQLNINQIFKNCPSNWRADAVCLGIDQFLKHDNMTTDDWARVLTVRYELLTRCPVIEMFNPSQIAYILSYQPQAISVFMTQSGSLTPVQWKRICKRQPSLLGVSPLSAEERVEILNACSKVKCR